MDIRNVLLIIITGLFIVTACKKDKKAEEQPAIEPHLTVLWAKSYDYWSPGLSSEDFKDMQNIAFASDGGIAVCFTRFSSISSQYFNVLLKIGNDGNTIFCREYPGENGFWKSVKASVTSTSDNGFLFYNIMSANSSPDYSTLLKADGNGTTEWEKNFDFWPELQLYVLFGGPSGDFYALGNADSIGNFMLHLNSNGDTIKSYKLNTTFLGPFSANYNGTGEITLAGINCENNGNLNYFGKVARVDTAGNLLWLGPDIRITNSDEPVVITGMFTNADHSTIVTGGYGGFFDFYITGTLAACVSSTGALSWVKFINEIPHGCDDIEPSANGGYILATNQNSQIAVIDENGNFQWIEYLEGAPVFSGVTLKKTGDDYLLFGFAWNIQTHQESPVLVKFSVR